MAIELVDVELLHGGEVTKTVTSSLETESQEDADNLIKDMLIHFGVSGPDYQIRIMRKNGLSKTFPTEQ